MADDLVDKIKKERARNPIPTHRDAPKPRTSHTNYNPLGTAPTYPRTVAGMGAAPGRGFAPPAIRSIHDAVADIEPVSMDISGAPTYTRPISYTKFKNQVNLISGTQKKLHRKAYGISHPISLPFLWIYDSTVGLVSKVRGNDLEGLFSEQKGYVRTLVQQLNTSLKDSGKYLASMNIFIAGSMDEAVQHMQGRGKAYDEVVQLTNQIEGLRAQAAKLISNENLESSLNPQVIAIEKQILQLDDQRAKRYGEYLCSGDAFADNLSDSEDTRYVKQMFIINHITQQRMVERAARYERRLAFLMPGILHMIETQGSAKQLLKGLGTLTKMSNSLTQLAYNGVGRTLEGFRAGTVQMYDSANNDITNRVNAIRENYAQLNREGDERATRRLGSFTDRIMGRNRGYIDTGGTNGGGQIGGGNEEYKD